MGIRTTKNWIDSSGGFFVKLTNKSGGASVSGAIVIPYTSTALSVTTAGANSAVPLGTFRDSGVADGSEAWVGISGLCPCKADSGGIAIGDWIATGATASLVDGSASPAAAPAHFQEIGHALNTATNGAVARELLHFN